MRAEPQTVSADHRHVHERPRQNPVIAPRARRATHARRRGAQGPEPPAARCELVILHDRDAREAAEVLEVLSAYEERLVSVGEGEHSMPQAPDSRDQAVDHLGAVACLETEGSQRHAAIAEDFANLCGSVCG